MITDITEFKRIKEFLPDKSIGLLLALCEDDTLKSHDIRAKVFDATLRPNVEYWVIEAEQLGGPHSGNHVLTGAYRKSDYPTKLEAFEVHLNRIENPE